MAREIVGREAELAAIEEFLAAAAGLACLVLEGEPGIGKTAVWQDALGRATGAGLRVLSCRPVEAEAKLAFASLADLLAPVVDDELPELPEPQRLALEVALLRASPHGAPPSPRAVGTATFGVLRRAAADAPLVVAVDDVQWLDRASAAALAFALRRLSDSPVRVFAAARVVAGVVPDPLELESAFRERRSRIRLGPLTLGGLHHLIGTRLGRTLPRPTLRRIAQESGGNPLFALELARALLDAGARPGPGEPLPVPDTLGALLKQRVERLPRAAREALLAAAALSDPRPELIGAPDGLEAAERAGVVEVRNGRVRFSHPLLASTVYASASAERRRALHRRLAGAVGEPEERARHLALAAGGPDEGVAESLDAAARDANARGAPEVAAELTELACRLTPADGGAGRARRSLALCEYVFRAGDTGAARRLAEELVESEPPGPLRARALELLARMLHVAGTAEEAAGRCEQALGEAGDDVELLARVHSTLSLVSYHDFEAARRHAHASVALLEEVDDPDPGVLAQALWSYIDAEFRAGQGLVRDAVERALELERLAPATHVADRVSAALGFWHKHLGEFGEARSRLEETHRAAVEEGDEASLPYALSHFPQLELWTGNWRRAEETALEHLELAENMAQPSQRRQALYNLSLVHAHMGRVEEARAEAEELVAEAGREGDAWDASNGESVLGLLELSLGNPAGAATRLGRSVQLRDATGASEPLRAQGDHAEALLELGDVDRADGVARELDGRARAAGRPPLLAVAAWARGLVAAARGDLDAAAEALDEALDQHDRAPVPFDLARTLLAVGQVRRRRGERRAARDALERARRLFDELGAPLWSARAEAELRRIPIRRGAPDELTPTEEQVAELAATGLTNREVAGALFVSSKTVEANLARVYRKLGIASRAELGAKMLERRSGAAPAKP